MEEMEPKYLMSMNNKMIIIASLFSLLTLGCKDKSELQTTITKPAKVNINAIIASQADSAKLTKNAKVEIELKEVSPDSTINNLLFLENSESLKRFYSKDKMISTIEKLRESPIAVFSNNDKSQYLLAYHYEGNPKDQFSCFEIGYFENDKKLMQNLNYSIDNKIFETESKIGLGISLEKLIKIKGDSYVTKQDKDQLIITYRIDNYDKSSFLKRYNMPGYFMEFTLKDNMVIKILFGFDYP
ncbi:hypothetical protein SAMN05444484_10653 [Flavobacterium chilense]|uniref:Lipoprotein n=2 Tax=Flavobacterium chilense TaxID=946677 RepID=A0A1M7IUK8_9FLAO|nr:hypothetical protein SAMN05444484_10653 [Flavobacterium chilense]